MKILSNIYILLSALCILTLVSCEKEIDIDLKPSEPRVVIQGSIEFDKTASVKITMSKNYGENNQYPPITDAIVTLSDDTGASETLVPDASGWYKSTSIIGVQGRTYNLSVKMEKGEYTSVSTMPYAVTIDKLEMDYIAAMDAAFPMLTFQDPAGIDNYYGGSLYINGKRMPHYYVADDEDSDGKEINRLFMFDSSYNDEEIIKKGDIIIIEMQCWDKGVYEFFKTLGDVSESLANPTSNIKGGALGYFSAYTIDSIEITAEWEK